MERVYAVAREPILLGRTGEDRAREIAFDIGGWIGIYGEGDVQLLVRRSGEETMYPAALRTEGNLVLWVVTQADVAKVGRGGECELGFVTKNGAVVKSEVWETVVLPSMIYGQGEAPQAETAWLDAVRRVLAELSALGEKAREDIERSQAWAQEIAQASSDAWLSAAQAEASRRAVENLGVEATALETEASPTVEKKVIDGVVKLIFALPKGNKGDRGEKGERGERGESGVAAPVNGFFTMAVDDDGNLWVHTAFEGGIPAFEYDSETGSLYYVTE